MPEGNTAMRMDNIPLPPGIPMHKLWSVPRRLCHFFVEHHQGAVRIESRKLSTLFARLCMRRSQKKLLSNIHPSTFLHVERNRLGVLVFFVELGSVWCVSWASKSLM